MARGDRERLRFRARVVVGTTRDLPRLVLLTCVLLGLAACSGTPPAPQPTAMPSVAPAQVTDSQGAGATNTPQPPATSTPAPGPMATEIPPTATPLPAAIEVDLGVPGGDCYEILALASDPETERLFALCAHTDSGPGAAIAALDGDSRERLDTILLGKEGGGESGQLALDPEARRLYATGDGLHGLVVLDADSLAEVSRLPGVRWAVPAPGAGRLYAYDGGALAAYRVSDLDPLSSLARTELSPTSSEVLVSYNPAGDQLFVAPKIPGAESTPVQVRRGDDLTLVSEVVVPGSVRDLAADGDARRVYITTGTQLVAINGTDLTVTARDLALAASDGAAYRLHVDDRSGLVHVIVSRDDDALWLVLDGESLEPVAQHSGLAGRPLTALHRAGDLLAVQPNGDVVLRYSRQTGQPAGRIVLGKRLLALVTDPDGDRLYVVDSAGDLRTLDATTLETEEIHPGLVASGREGMAGSGDVALVLDPRGRRLFVADVRAGRTEALDLRTWEPVGTLDVAGPMAVDAASGRLFVADRNIYAFDATTLEPGPGPEGEAAISYEAGPDQPSVPSFRPGEVIVDSQRGHLLVRTVVGGSVHIGSANYGVYDPATLEPLAHLFVRGSNAYLGSPVYLPEVDRTWLAYTSGGMCDAGTGDATWDCRQGLIAFAGDFVELGQIKGLSGQLLTGGEHLFLRRDGDLVVLDPRKGYPLGNVPLGDAYQDALLDPQQKRLYLWGWDRLASRSTDDLLAEAHEAHPGSIPRAGRAFLYSSPLFETDHTLFAILPAVGLYRSIDEGATWQFSSQGLENYYFQDLLFSPDYDRDGTLFVTLEGGGAYRSTDQGETWLPDGPPRLAFVSDRTGDKEIYLQYYHPDVAPLGSDPWRLTDNPAEDDNPAWSPGGERLVFQSDRSGNFDLWLVNWDGSGLRQLTTDPADDLLPAWNPAGGQIAFVSLRDGNPEIYLIDLADPGQGDGAPPVRRLTDHPAGDWRPAWNAAGTQLAFASTRDGDNEIYMINADGSGLVQLTDNEADDRDPAWQSGGLFFLSDRDGNVDIFRMDVEAGTAAPVTRTGYDESHVAPGPRPYHPDLFYASDYTGDAEIYSLITAWSQATRHTEDAGHDTAPAWALSSPQSSVPPTPTPIPPTPIPVPETAAVETPGSSSPAVAGIPLPAVAAAISAENAGLVTELAHWGGGEVKALAHSPDGKLLGVASEGGIYLYDAATMAEIAFLKTSRPVVSLGFSRPAQDGSTRSTVMAAGGHDGTVALWQVGGCGRGSDAARCGQFLHSWPAHSDTVQSLAFSPAPGDGAASEMLATGSWDHTVRLWRVSGCANGVDACGNLLGTLAGHTSWVSALAFSPDSGTLASGARGGVDGSLRLWDVAGCTAGGGSRACGQPIDSLEGHQTAVPSLAFGPQGTLASADSDGTVRLWDVSGCPGSVGCGRLLHTLDGGDSPILDVDLTGSGPDAEIFAGSERNLVRLWRAHDGELLESHETYNYPAEYLDFNPAPAGSETWVTASSTHRLIQWQVTDGEPVRTPQGYVGYVLSVAFGPSPEGEMLALGTAGGMVQLRRTNDGKLLRILEGHQDGVTTVAFSPPGAGDSPGDALLASGSADGTVRLWQVGGCDGESTACGTLLHTLEGHTDGVTSVAFGSAGAGTRLLASASEDHTVRLWAVGGCGDAGEGCGTLLRTLEGHTGGVRSVAFSPLSPDGRGGAILASGGSWEDSTVRLWRIAACPSLAEECGSPLDTLQGHTASVNGLAFSPGGSLLASAAADSTVRLWEVEKCGSEAAGCARPLRTLGDHSDRVQSVSFGPEGDVLASGSADLTVRLWAVGGCGDQPGGCGDLLRTLDGHTGPVQSVAFGATMLASGASDNSVRLWGIAEE